MCIATDKHMMSSDRELDVTSPTAAADAVLRQRRNRRNDNAWNQSSTTSEEDDVAEPGVPIETVLAPPTMLARYSAASILVAIFAIWGKYTFIAESDIPGGKDGPELHSWRVPLVGTLAYLASLPLLRYLSKRFLLNSVDTRVLLREAMILYNAGQVLLNIWMVYRILDALVFRGHPFIAGPIHLVDTGASYAVYVHYCDKYLEFLDTFFMVLRGKMNQVSFLHVYHHTSIAWAWWFGLKLYPGGDIYFGALLNSLIHVMMYSYYTLSLLKIQCPWKRYLTQAQLLQFLSVLAYSALSMYRMPEEGNWTHYLAYSIQVFEMTSLFVLFLHFYFKAYSNKKARKAIADKEVSSEASTASISSASSDEQSS